jgi:hypothetical protein
MHYQLRFHSTAFSLRLNALFFIRDVGQNVAKVRCE